MKYGNKQTINGNACMKAAKIIKTIYDTGKMPKDFTLSSFREFETCFDYLYADGKTETINERVKNKLISCGFTCKNKGIGWEIV